MEERDTSSNDILMDDNIMAEDDSQLIHEDDEMIGIEVS